MNPTTGVITVMRPEGAIGILVRASSAVSFDLMCAKAFKDSPALYVRGCSDPGAGDNSYVSAVDWATSDSLIYSVQTFSDSSKSSVGSSLLYSIWADGTHRELLE